jgi:glycosyltransferase involved in cell wall biosynthesis
VRIAQVAPLYESVPPQGYGGTERVVAALCDGLVDRGHDVTLFAASSSQTRAHLVECTPAPLRTRLDRTQMLEIAPRLHQTMLESVYDRAGDFDVIHSHVDLWTAPYARACTSTPTVVTMHGRLDTEYMRSILVNYRDVPLVSISRNQRRPVSHLDLPWVANVPNGLDLTRYRRTIAPRGDHLVFVGRIHPEKAPAMAVEVARRSSRPLHVAAKIDPLDVAYWESEIQPLFEREGVRFRGEILERDKPAFYAGASATLFPSDWPEPFGLVLIESMATGTPVIALRRGSVPEIVADGVTGFICDGVDEMVDAVARVEKLDREECRRHAATFSARVMCARYEAVYISVAGHRERRATPAV